MTRSLLTVIRHQILVRNVLQQADLNDDLLKVLFAVANWYPLACKGSKRNAINNMLN